MSSPDRNLTDADVDAIAERVRNGPAQREEQAIAAHNAFLAAALRGEDPNADTDDEEGDR